jgi:hypothetical protein
LGRHPVRGGAEDPAPPEGGGRRRPRRRHRHRRRASAHQAFGGGGCRGGGGGSSEGADKGFRGCWNEWQQGGGWWEWLRGRSRRQQRRRRGRVEVVSGQHVSQGVECRHQRCPPSSAQLGPPPEPSAPCGLWTRQQLGGWVCSPGASGNGGCHGTDFVDSRSCSSSPGDKHGAPRRRAWQQQHLNTCRRRGFPPFPHGSRRDAARRHHKLGPAARPRPSKTLVGVGG